MISSFCTKSKTNRQAQEGAQIGLVVVISDVVLIESMKYAKDVMPCGSNVRVWQGRDVGGLRYEVLRSTAVRGTGVQKTSASQPKT